MSKNGTPFDHLPMCTTVPKIRKKADEAGGELVTASKPDIIALVANVSTGLLIDWSVIGPACVACLGLALLGLSSSPGV